MAAYQKARSIINNDIFGHTIGNKSFSSWIKDVGYSYQYVGENLAIDFMSTEGTLKAWLNSPSHKKNILNNRFSETGVAVVNGIFKGKNSSIIVQIFALPSISLPQSNNNPSLASSNNYFGNYDYSRSTTLLSHSENKNFVNKQKMKPDNFLNAEPIKPILLFDTKLFSWASPNSYFYIYYLLLFFALSLSLLVLFSNHKEIQNLDNQQ
jgi:hypothetical protein